ncbi:stage 0 sporulation regulatory protein [Bacillus sp. LL01]|nr:stage 0 sporulation regulatory protein [Bacillus sp. LL01]
MTKGQPINTGVIALAKRKVAHDAAQNNNKTPKESLPDTEFSAEYQQEDMIRGANRNSKKGRQGK